MKPKRLFVVMMCIVLLVGVFCSCSKTESTGQKGENAAEGESAEKIQLLTHVFRGKELVLPDDLRQVNSVDIKYTESGSVKLCCYKTIQDGEENVWKNYICEMNLDGSDPVLTEIVLETENIRISYGTFTRETFVFVGRTENEAGVANYALYVYRPGDGSYEIMENIKELRLVEGKLHLRDLQTDEEGYLYLLTETSFGVLNPDGTRLFERNVSYDGGMERDAEGNVYLTGYLNGGNGRNIMRIDRKTKSLEVVCTLPAGIQAKNYYIGVGYDVYYTDSDGLYGYNTGMEAGEMVMNWDNSSLSMESVIRMQVLSPEMMVIHYNDMSPGNFRLVSAVFTKTADIDLTQLVTIQLACVGQEPDFSAAVSFYNKNNLGVRVVVRDYSVYNTEENETGGETRLINDILNGLYKPDIVAGGSDGRLIPTMIDKRMFVDLYSFMDEDDPVQKEDLVGCVKNTFEVDGQLSAICRSFAVTTLLAKKDTVGDKTSWTLDEMLDFAFSQGEDQYMMSWLGQNDAVKKLLGSNSYNQFIDTEHNTCDFDSPTFVRLLEYIALLGEKGMYDRNGSNRYEATQTRKVMLYRWYCDGLDELQLERVPFNTEDVVRIGFPTSGGEKSGTEVTFNDVCQSFLIPSVSEHPEAAWKFLSYYVGTPDQLTFFGFSSLKSLIYDEAEKEEGKFRFFGYDGTNYKWGSGIEKEITYGEDGTARLNGQPGILTEFSREKLDGFVAWLDTIGTPIGEIIPEEVTNIIEEEISTFIGGARGAEDTAKIIQSRVSLWLAEHS